MEGVDIMMFSVPELVPRKKLIGIKKELILKCYKIGICSDRGLRTGK